ASAESTEIVILDRSLLVRKKIENLPAQPRGVLFGLRSEIETIYVADGFDVTEYALPIPSPIPVLEALRAALAASDVDAALETIHPLQRPIFEDIYAQISGR